MTAVAVPARTRASGPRSRGVAPPRAHLVVVEATPRVRVRRAALVALGVVVVLALVTVVASHALLAQGQVRIEHLDAATATAERDYEQARYAHATLASPVRIVQRAGELGLVPPAGPPVAVAIAGDVPVLAGTAGTLHGWTEVKPTLADPR